MIFPKEFIENLKNRVSVSDIVSRYVNLKSKGKGTFSGLCPFHNEKTPSFSVSDAKGFYHCFGCGAHGNAISFLMEHKGYSFPEAIKELAGLAGMELPKQDERVVEKQKQVQSSYELMELATRYFEKNLYSSQGLEARKYIENRGLTAETLKKFRIGLALDEWEGLKNHLKTLGANEDLMIANGLLAEKEESGKTYDRFRNRLIFPIFDSSNRVIAFGGRILNNTDKSAKYLNSSETDLFKKSYVLYGYNFARDAGYKKAQAIVVEGYMDAISMHQAGFDNTVAPLGTAVTESHLFHLWKMTPEPIFCLDSDEAGQRASKRLAEEFIKYLKPGYSMKFAIVPSGKDPDDFIKTEGRQAMEELLNNATPLVDALWNFNIVGADVSTPEKKANFSKALQDIANRIEDPIVRDFYKAEFTARVKKHFAPVNSGNVVNFSKYQKSNAQKSLILSPQLSASKGFSDKKAKHMGSERQEEKILLLIAFFPNLTKLANVEDF
ncbi:MAG TPA: DNA primase, partial [Alphaproteobacteria bacterium]|nr:DNA primase [Alphaproteobacteria bacterium]